ncbi:MAG: SHOCT domain-containing protein [Planococcus sp. (in: firmicutes)]|uniref:SHOCT domain-containing protein n=1 Tax=Planococcus halocryophilus TaxID=1215089 RepID=UPI001F1116C6|nr:SHOCT domain-containing protein [Planococcus halocryophilus]MCH4826703.1 SHOCT domain-containing protein [Planococcus halocryophilus]
MGEFFTPGNQALGVTIAVGFIVVLTLIGGALWFTLIKARKNAASTEPHESDHAIESLRQRYVRGEISKEQYDEQLRLLKESPKN